MKTLEVCGYNGEYCISEKSNNKTYDQKNTVFPPILSSFDVSKILSYSIYFHTIAVTTDGIAHGIGDNREGQISGSLPKEILDHFTDIPLIDSDGCLCKVISAVCGIDYTLYMISSVKSERKQLAYAHSRLQSPYPIILNIGEVIPVSLFGGRNECAAIDSEGGIIYINYISLKSPTNKIERTFLPFGEKAVSVACIGSSIISLSSSGRVFKSEFTYNPSFTEVQEVKGNEIINISGTFLHCFLVSKDGKVFVKGKYANKGELGLGMKIKEVNKFTEISSLNKYKITAAYAGLSHSLFQTQEGKILACGKNNCGELLIKVNESKIYEPIETGVTNVSFCIVGRSATAIFKNYEPPMNPNKQINFEKLQSKYVIESEISYSKSNSESEILSLKSKIDDLENKLINKEKELNEQKIKYETQIAQKEKDFEEQLCKQKEQYELKINQHKQEKLQPVSEIKDKNIEILDIETLNSFEQEKEISFGRSGKVFKVSKKKYYALKVMNINITQEEFKQFIKEYELMCILEHTNIVKAYGIFLSDKTHPPSILLEFCPMNLEEAILKKTFSNVEIAFIIYELVEGMKYVHHRKIIHRDLKPRNILIGSDGHIKISDFGISKLMSAETQSMTGGVGTQKFMAPEIIDESEHYDEKVDVYSFGVVLFFILTAGEMPKIKLSEILTGKKAPIPTEINEFARDLISKCWNFQSIDRPSFDDISIYIESNNYNLINLTKSEIEEVKQKIKMYKEKLPIY